MFIQFSIRSARFITIPGLIVRMLPLLALSTLPALTRIRFTACVLAILSCFVSVCLTMSPVLSVSAKFRRKFVTVFPLRCMEMTKTLSYVLFALRNLPRFSRLCVQLLEEWYKLEHCEKDEVGVL